MLQEILKLYRTAMMFDVRSKIPHLVGPAGCGKTSSVEQLAELLGVDLHIINVARLSPLEIEGVQMPHGKDDEMILRMLPATFWTQLREGDILLFDEFLRGFPEVYNALLDIFTARRVGAFRLPKVFIVATSNSVATYDPALEDRLLHIPVKDPRKYKSERKVMAKLIVNAVGLLPLMVTSPEMEYLIEQEVLPMYDVLDTFGARAGSKVADMGTGQSVRSLIGQAQLRYVTSGALKDLIGANNMYAMSQSKPQYVVLLSGKDVPSGYADEARKLVKNNKLTELQRKNLEINLQLMELQEAMSEKEDA